MSFSVETIARSCRESRGVSRRANIGRSWGPTGSGKTTLLKILTGYEWKTRGAVSVLGARLWRNEYSRVTKAHWLGQLIAEHRLPGRDLAVDVTLSGLEASLGLYREFSAAERQLAFDTLAWTGGERIARQEYNTLSQGEQQRVLIARALICRPALLILDEPCVGLDPAARHSFLKDVARLATSADRACDHSGYPSHRRDRSLDQSGDGDQGWENGGSGGQGRGFDGGDTRLGVWPCLQSKP